MPGVAQARLDHEFHGDIMRDVRRNGTLCHPDPSSSALLVITEITAIVFFDILQQNNFWHSDVGLHEKTSAGCLVTYEAWRNTWLCPQTQHLAILFGQGATCCGPLTLVDFTLSPTMSLLIICYVFVFCDTRQMCSPHCFLQDTLLDQGGSSTP